MSYYQDLPGDHPLHTRQEAKIAFVDATLASIRQNSHMIRERLPKLSIEDLEGYQVELRRANNELLEILERIARQTG